MREGWVELSLGELTENTRPICYGVLKPGPQVEGGVPLVKITDMDRRILGPEGMQQISNELDNEFRRSRLQGGEVLLSIQGTVGRVAIAASTLEGANISRTIAVIDPDDRLHNFYLMYVLEKIATEGNYDSAGSTRESLNISTIRSMKILCPPIPEQKRIVDLISSVDSYIEALQQHLESAKKARNAVLHELLTARGDDWEEHKLIDMFEIYQPQTIAKSLMSEDGEFTVFGANGPIGRYHEFNHDEPEVVVTCRGATCGTVNMTPPKTWITGNAMVVSPKTSEVSKEFLYWALVSGVDIQSVISGSAQPQITREGLAPVKIKIPPLSRQVEIVDLISGFELNISYLEESIHKTKTLRSGLLSDLLSGKHEIPASYDKVIGAA